jgi:tubulin beta
MTPTYADLNWLATLALSDATAPLRFPSLVHDHMRKLCVDMVPFPRLHFLNIGIAPLKRFANKNSNDEY